MPYLSPFFSRGRFLSPRRLGVCESGNSQSAAIRRGKQRDRVSRHSRGILLAFAGRGTRAKPDYPSIDGLASAFDIDDGHNS